MDGWMDGWMSEWMDRYNRMASWADDKSSRLRAALCFFLRLRTVSTNTEVFLRGL